MKKLVLLVFISIVSFASSYNQKMLSQIEAQNSDGKVFSFAVMGDNRDGNSILQKILHKLDTDKSIKFALNNGDLVSSGYEREFKNYLNVIKTCKKPIVSIIGNHEIPWYGEDGNYIDTFGKTYFSFTYKNSYFIVLNDSSKEGLGKKQRRWLEKELQNAQKYEHRFVFLNVPLYNPKNGKYEQGHSLDSHKKAKRLNDIFDKYNVSMIFSSHISSYFRGVWQKTPYIITGGAGAPLKENSFYHYIKVIVDGDKIEYKVVKLDVKTVGMWLDEMRDEIVKKVEAH